MVYSLMRLEMNMIENLVNPFFLRPHNVPLHVSFTFLPPSSLQSFINAIFEVGFESNVRRVNRVVFLFDVLSK
jgi:hypothetical protein